MFDLLLQEGVVPLEWKEANIILLFYKDSRNKLEKHRPVSLTSVICKLLERLIKNHFVDFLVKNNLIYPSQRGFLKNEVMLNKYVVGRSGITSRYNIIRFFKAFDKVPHQRLLLKLKAHGIGNGMISWIEKWLIDRGQRVVVDGGFQTGNRF